MGIESASDLFQAHVVGLFQGMGENKLSLCIDNMIHTKSDRYESNLDIYDKILIGLEVSGMEISVRSVFAATRLKFPGIKLSQIGYAPIPT